MCPNRVETYANARRVEADFADYSGLGYHFYGGFLVSSCGLRGVDLEDDEVLLLGGQPLSFHSVLSC
jgi:hypothetical protein